MRFLKNRTVIGVICIVLSLIICFAVTPLFNQKEGLIPRSLLRNKLFQDMEEVIY